MRYTIKWMEIVKRILFLISLLLAASNLLNFVITIQQCTFWPPTSSNVPENKFEKAARLLPSTPPTSHDDTKLEAFQKYTKDSSCQYKDSPLEKLVCQVEASSSLFYTYKPHPLVLAKDLSLLRYYAQRDLHSWTLAYSNISFELTETSFKSTTRLSEASVLLCLGIIAQDKYCLKPSSYKLLTQGHRISQVHGMRDILWRKDAFCYTLRESLHGYRGWNNFTFPCWVLPHDKGLLLEEMEKNDKKEYIVKPSFRGEGHGIYVVRSMTEIDLSSGEDYVVQPFLKKPFLVRGRKFDFRTYVLVTSISPLRLYFYKEGLVRFASTKYNHNATKGGKEQQFLTNTSVGKKFTSLANLTWTYGRLMKYFEKRGINGDKVFDSVRNAITRTLLASEFRFTSDIKYNLGGYDCHNCFQLLGIDVILDEDLHPIVIEVNGLPSMQLSHEMGVLPNPSSPYTITKYGLLHHMLRILYGNVSIASTLVKGLEILKIGIGPGPLCNGKIHLYCIDVKTLTGVISSMRERLLSGDFIRLYPARDGERYSRLIKHLHSLVDRKMKNSNNHRTLWQLHHLLTALDKLEI